MLPDEVTMLLDLDTVKPNIHVSKVISFKIHPDTVTHTTGH